MGDPNLRAGDSGFFSRLAGLGRSQFRGVIDLPDLEALSGFLNARGKAVLSASLQDSLSFRSSLLSLLGVGSGSGSAQLADPPEDAAATLLGEGSSKKRLRRPKLRLRRGLATDDAGLSLDDEANEDSSGDDQSRRGRSRRRRTSKINLADQSEGVSEAEGQEASDAADDASDAMDSSVDLPPSVAPVGLYSSPATAGVMAEEVSEAGESESEDGAVVADGGEASSGVAEGDASAEEDASAEAGIVDAGAEPADGGEAPSFSVESSAGADTVEVDCIDDDTTGPAGLGGVDDHGVDSDDDNSHAESSYCDDSSDLWMSGSWGDLSRSSAETALNSEVANVCCSKGEDSFCFSDWDSGVSSGANSSVSSYQLNVQMGASDALGQAMKGPFVVDTPMHGGSSPHSDLPEEALLTWPLEVGPR